MRKKVVLIQKLIVFWISILILIGCQNRKSLDIHINYENILNYLSYQQMADGGFSDDISLSIVQFIDYHDTFMSLHILQLVDYELTNEEKTRTHQFLDRTDIKDLIYDELMKVLLYLEIVNMVEYPICEESLSKLLYHIAFLQTDIGYFVQSREERILLENELLTDGSGPFSGFNLSYISMVLALGISYEIDFEFASLFEYLILYLSEDIKIDFNLSNTSQIAAAAIIVRLLDISPGFIDIDVIETIRKLYSENIETITVNERGYYDVGITRDMITIGNFLNKTDHEVLKNSILRFYAENGFSPFLNSSAHINATRLALLALKELYIALDENTKNDIIEKILNNRFYDGRFVVERRGIFVDDRIRDTYNAMMLLDELDALDNYLLDLKKFFESKLATRDIAAYSLIESFHLLSIANVINADLCNNILLDFIVNFSEYVNNEMLVNFPFAIAVMKSEVITNELLANEEIRIKLINSTKREDHMQNYITQFLSLYYKYAVFRYFELEYTHLVNDILDFYNRNFSRIELRLFAMRYIVDMIKNEQLSSGVISNKNKHLILEEIVRSQDGFLFGYTDDFPGKFDSTRSVIRMIRLFNGPFDIRVDTAIPNTRFHILVYPSDYHTPAIDHPQG